MGLFLLGAAGTTATGGTPPTASAAAHANGQAPVVRVFCRPYAHVTTVPVQGARYVIRNDNYGHLRECISNKNRSVNFLVVRSGALVAHFEPVAYPNIFVGCSWGICTPHSGLPRRLSRVRSFGSSWSTTEKAAGKWGSGYDIWLDRGRHTSGQSTGAEVMIWISSRGFGPNTWPVVVVDHVRWHLAHWVTGKRGQRWNYVQFRRLRSAGRVVNLPLMPFIAAAERYGLVKRTWWLTSVEAGFEIWRGGTGLGTTSFSVRMRTRVWLRCTGGANGTEGTGCRAGRSGSGPAVRSGAGGS